MARPPKPIEVHRIEGTYRSDRHTERGETPSGSPFVELEPPERLHKTAKEVWERTIKAIDTKTLSELDKESLAAYCETVAIYHKVAPKYFKDPTDHQLRMAWKESLSLMDRLGAQFGWTPKTRSALQLPPGSEELTALEKMMIEKQERRA